MHPHLTRSRTIPTIQTMAAVLWVRLTLPVCALAGLGVRDAHRHFAERGLDVELHLVDDNQAPALRRLRSDLHEITFATEPLPVGG